MNASRNDRPVATVESAAGKTGAVRWSAYATFFTLAALGGSLDLLTKQAVFRTFGFPGQQPTWWLIQDRLGIQTALNPGALFGMGGGKRLVFAALSVGALIAIVIWLFVYKAARDRWLTFALGLICGGIVGNLYDRLGFWHRGGLPAGVNAEFTGAVRDWILFQWKEVPLKILNPWPNFNLADSFLVVGAILLGIHALTYREKPAAEPLPQSAKT